jgi:hypothetical protein
VCSAISMLIRGAKLTAGERERELARLGKERRKTMAQYEREMRRAEGAGLLPRMV